MQTKLPTGADIIDWLLEGGYEHDCITTIYGPAGSGKTNLCMIAAANTPKGQKTIYIDTEGSFSIARFRQIRDDWEELLGRIIILQPTTFREQKESFEKLQKLINDKVAMIIVDSIAMLYRIEMGKTKDVHTVNRELGVQLASLTQITRKHKIPILITNQVYADFEDKDNIKMVGGDLLKYASKCLIELQNNNHREAILRKHRSIEENKKVRFQIVDKGVQEDGSG